MAETSSGPKQIDTLNNNKDFKSSPITCLCLLDKDIILNDP